MSEPLVSVVTPFHNTAPYLAQCIESVLAQSYSQFEYILSDNCSTDGSSEIAETYARRDSRIRIVRQPRLYPQVQHYNRALAEISGASRYCKMVQADDLIFPECLRMMVQTFELSESIGLVTAYDLKGNIIRGSGFPYPTSVLPGKEMGRLYVRTGTFVFGSPTTVMYRSSLVRECQPFYDESLLHEDTEKCLQILRQWDFGFVHQVLSFLRVDNESVSSAARGYQPIAVDSYILNQRYAPIFLDAAEAEARRKESKRTYYRVLAKEALRIKDAAFWRYHEAALRTLGQTLDWPYLALQIGWELLWIVTNPGMSAGRAYRLWKRTRARRRAAQAR